MSDAPQTGSLPRTDVLPRRPKDDVIACTELVLLKPKSKKAEVLCLQIIFLNFASRLGFNVAVIMLSGKI